MKVSMAPIQKLFSKNVQQPNSNASSSGEVEIVLSNKNKKNNIIKTLKAPFENLKKECQKDSLVVSQASQETAIHAQEESSDILQLESINNVLENATDAVLKSAADTGTSGPTFLERLYQFIMNLLSKLFPNLVPAQVSNLA